MVSCFVRSYSYNKIAQFYSQTTRTYLNISRRNTRSFQINYKTNKCWFKKFQGCFLDGGASILYSGTRKENWRESQRQKRLGEKIGKNWRGFFKKCAKVIYSLGQRRKFEECLCKHDIRKQERRSNVSRKLLNNYVTRIFLEHYKHYLKINNWLVSNCGRYVNNPIYTNGESCWSFEKLSLSQEVVCIFYNQDGCAQI